MKQSPIQVSYQPLKAKAIECVQQQETTSPVLVSYQLKKPEMMIETILEKPVCILTYQTVKESPVYTSNILNIIIFFQLIQLISLAYFI